MSKPSTIEYSNVFFSCFYEDETSCMMNIGDHALTYIFEGELEVECQGKRSVFRKNQCVFLRRDFQVKFTKKPYKNEQYKGISIVLKRNVLRDIYKTMDKNAFPKNAKRLKNSVLEIDNRPDIESLFLSMIPYFNSTVQPHNELITMKIHEAVLALLQLDERFYPTLFDFNEAWKIDILEFMNRNFMYELSIDEIANQTGRSLATFKRDFAKISEIPPQKWLIHRRLEAAREHLEQGEKPSKVFTDVGFKSLPHFYQAFQKYFGYSISQVGASRTGN